jgi:hypothetical protein
MTAKFIVRLLDETGGLLAWAEVLATAKPQGRPRSTPFKARFQTLFPIERDGIAAGLSVHWADLDVARYSRLMNPCPVLAGQVMRFDWIEPVWMVKGGEGEIPLPPVTVGRPVTIGIPVGGLGVVAPV